ncbi:hypothetical protein PJL18_01126 [Paenarthrobacter nicotinovorans]|nr:hypothetical protein [Paenarthrobacter nicotinovorans]
MVPVKPPAGVTVTLSPPASAVPCPVSVTAETIFSGVSGNGFESLASTFTVTGFPDCASGSASSLATGLGRLDAESASL